MSTSGMHRRPFEGRHLVLYSFSFQVWPYQDKKQMDEILIKTELKSEEDLMGYFRQEHNEVNCYISKVISAI